MGCVKETSDKAGPREVVEPYLIATGLLLHSACLGAEAQISVLF